MPPSLVIALEHSVPIAQGNPEPLGDAPATVDPVKRYLHFEKAFLNGELDPAFEGLSSWELRMVVDGDEPDETLAWGREMLRNFRPDHIFTTHHGWRYSGLVGSDVRYGSGDVKHDRPELQRYQNILMNGGICGRRAFFGRFILRAHGIPTIAKPSRGHGALARWPPDGWVVHLGPNWGGGWTGTRYKNDHDFVATTQARANRDGFLQVKRAQWGGDVTGEMRSYGEHDGDPTPWNAVSLRTQRAILDGADTKKLAALGEELGESNTPLSVAAEVLATEIKPEDKQITVGADGTFTMGGERTTDGRFECVEVPRHEVTLTKGFYLGKYEVTQAQYEAIMGSNPSGSSKGPDFPVDNVSEQDAHEFCQKLAEKAGKEARLPTEAEWEYAARAGKDTKWFFGDDPAALGDYAWFKDNGGGKSHPVGQKKPNPWGLYDIYGNVCERISDTYAKNYYAQGRKTDPTGPSQGDSSRFEYEVTVPSAGNYSLTAEVVTVNYDQRLNVATNGSEATTILTMPFTLGKWQQSEPVMLTLKEGGNELRFWRDQPPQYGLAIKSFTLQPAAR